MPRNKNYQYPTPAPLNYASLLQPFPRRYAASPAAVSPASTLDFHTDTIHTLRHIRSRTTDSTMPVCRPLSSCRRDSTSRISTDWPDWSCRDSSGTAMYGSGVDRLLEAGWRRVLRSGRGYLISWRRIVNGSDDRRDGETHSGPWFRVVKEEFTAPVGADSCVRMGGRCPVAERGATLWNQRLLVPLRRWT